MEKYLWQYVMMVDPFAKEDDIEEIQELNEWDLLIAFKDGRKILFDRATNYHKDINYNSIKELSKEQEKIEFAYMLRSLMRRACVTQEQLADKVGLTQAMISRYARGEAVPSAILLNSIAKVLGCSMDDFFNKNY